jgi:non-specific serine/threonine protein kinase
MSPRRVHDLERGPRLPALADTTRGLANTPGLNDPDATALRTAGAYRVVAEGVTAWPSLSALPVKLSSFVGRQHELAELRHRLEVDRLVSLVGPGGIGKTRLALEAARGLSSRYADGLALADLAPLAAPQLVVQAVAQAVGVRIELDREPQAAVVSLLATRRVLMILDNCEHLADACAELVTPLLERCPNVTVLATSREPLGVDGEVVWRLAPLDEAAAMTLFVDRARARRGDFDPADGRVVRQVCLALDGLPLAIELAAARVSLLTPSEMLPRLQDRFALLQQVGGRGGSPRQHTLRAAIDWSHDLLELAERQLFRRLAVFAGPFDLAGATALQRSDAVDVLGRLVDKSLVEAQTGTAGTRYRLLDSVRHYAWDRLREAGEVELARRRHLHHFLRRAEALFTPSASVDDPTRELDGELDNLRSAFEYCIEADPQAGLQLIGATRLVWWRRSLAEGRRWARAFLERCPDPGFARAQALASAGLFEVHGDPAEARRLLSEARGLAARFDQSELAAVDFYLGLAAWLGEDIELSIPHLERAIDLMERLGNRHSSVISQVVLGWALLTDHARREEARGLLEHAHELAEQLGDRHGVAAADYGLGLYWRWTGHSRRALDHFRRGVELMGRLEDIPELAGMLLHIARLLARDEPVRSARLASAGLATAERAGVHLPPRLLGSIEHLRAQLGQRLGGAQVGRTWAEGERLTIEEAVTLARDPVDPTGLRNGGLTSRELELTQLVARDLSSRDMGDLLHLSPRTVDTHLARIYAKLGLSSRLQLATWFAQTGAAEPRAKYDTPLG